MRTLLQTHWPIVLFLGSLLIFWAGAAFWVAWIKHRESQRRKAPNKWPLSARPIINSEERRIWRWLELAFIDYSVMVKMPVTRFSMPKSHKEGVYWYQLLSSLYCSFTVVRADGQVMGCIDLPSRSGQKRKSQRMKASILAQCGIPYVVMQTGAQPSLLQMRSKFLGEASAMPQSTQQAAALHAASSHLRNSILLKRQTRPAVPEAQGASCPDKRMVPDSVFSDVSSSGFSIFGQEDSFIMPLDSRAAALKK